MSASVSFNAEVRIYLVPLHTEYSDEERGALWMTPSDTEEIQKDMRRTVKAVRRAARHGTQIGSDNVCDRGLEHLRSTAHMEQRKINRDCCVQAVYDEQRRQILEGINDEEALADASMQGSRWARQLARENGINDAAVAQKLRREQVRRYQPTTDILERAMKLCDTTSAPLAEESNNQAAMSMPQRGQISLHLRGFQQMSNNAGAVKSAKQRRTTVASSPLMASLFANSRPQQMTSMLSSGAASKRRIIEVA